MIITMDTYIRLGDQRRVLEDWLYTVGLLPGNHITEIRFGEGVHHLVGYANDPEDPALLHLVAGVPVPREWDWAGPLPPQSVCARVKQLEISA